MTSSPCCQESTRPAGAGNRGIGAAPWRSKAGRVTACQISEASASRTVETSTVRKLGVIDQPRDEVFAFWADPDNIPLWTSNIPENEHTESPMRKGTQTRGTTKVFLDDDVDRFASWRHPPWMQLRRLTNGPVEVGTRCETARASGESLKDPSSPR